VTSSSAPAFYLDWLDLAAAPCLASVSGRLGMSILPGRRCAGKTAKEPRDLLRDAETLATIGVDAFVLLVEDHELIGCGVPSFIQVLDAHGIPVLGCPIVDHLTPADRSTASPASSEAWGSGRPLPAPGDINTFRELLREIERRLRAGQTLAVSCHGGLGRTGTLAACLLKDAGLDAETAMSVVRRSRPGAIENSLQEEFVRGW
jgi:hypothetical protein